ncbi:dUTP diphosphatase [Siminovitchia terrae]|uniref:dUTP diphosphatase n=1 Tax=Siminovitchia terrae TaxID=1914933 RepID=UPI0028AC9F95|nr:dUTP diphosphatase [Siminovitchia terrae]
MNLEKLFQMQDVLDERIVKDKGLEGQDLLDKKILALQVELGELANEQRTWKFWSEDQEPRVSSDEKCWDCDGRGVHLDRGAMSFWECETCDGFGKIRSQKNPLLEEYVDCLHFILSIGLELQFGDYPLIGNAPETRTVTHMFLITFEAISNFYKVWQLGNESLIEVKYTIVFNCFLTLGEMLGFTWEQVEQAYIEKNEINHQRQEAGY